jgi:hypothetical protein
MRFRNEPSVQLPKNESLRLHRSEASVVYDLDGSATKIIGNPQTQLSLDGNIEAFSELVRAYRRGLRIKELFIVSTWLFLSSTRSSYSKRVEDA